MTDVAIPDLNASPSAELTDLYEISKSNLSYKQSLQQVLTLFNGKIQSAITDDSSTNAAMYLTWVTATTGNLPLYVSSTKLSFHPDTGILSTINLNLNALTASQVVVTNASKTFASLAYGTTATANLLVQRDGSGNITGIATGNLPLSGGSMTGDIDMQINAINNAILSSGILDTCRLGNAFDLQSQTLNNGALINGRIAGSFSIYPGTGNSTLKLGVYDRTDSAFKDYLTFTSGFSTTLLIQAPSNGAVTIDSPTLSGTPLSTTPSTGDNSTSIATTAFVTTAINAVLSGAPNKAACKYSSTTALTVIYNNGTSGVGATLTGVALGALTLDGGSPAIGDRVSIKNQASPAQNGIYVVTVAGDVATAFVLTRSSDFNQSSEIAAGDTVFITNGTTLANTTWVMITAGTITVGTTAINWTQTAGPGSYVAGTGLTLSGSTFSITNTVTAATSGSTSVIPIITYNAQGQITSVSNSSGIVASTAATLATPRTINGVNFDGSANIIAPILGQTLANVGTCVVGVDNIISNGTLASAAYPTAINAGQIFKLTCTSASGIQLIQNAGQQTRFIDVLTTSGAGGSLNSVNVGQCDITVLCTVTNTTFQVISATGLWSIV